MFCWVRLSPTRLTCAWRARPRQAYRAAWLTNRLRAIRMQWLSGLRSSSTHGLVRLSQCSARSSRTSCIQTKTSRGDGSRWSKKQWPCRCLFLCPHKRTQEPTFPQYLRSLRMGLPQYLVWTSSWRMDSGLGQGKSHTVRQGTHRFGCHKNRRLIHQPSSALYPC